jgi:predicted negative regulator of RcsB-dependent stress response
MARFRRKDLKRPDVFVSTTQRFLEWAITHQRNLLIGGGGILAVLLVLGAISLSNAARQRQANEELSRALATLRAENYPDAATQLRTVADSWSSTAVGKLARLYAADAQLEAGNPDLAATDLNTLLADPPPADYLEQQAALNLGYSLEAKQDYAGAADSYAKAAAISGPYRALSLQREGRMREQLGDKERAEKVYETFLQDFPEAAEVKVIEAKLRSF